MKKLMFVAALVVAGMVSAGNITSSQEKVEVAENQKSNALNILKIGMKNTSQSAYNGNHNWIAIDSGCGQQYFLDLNHYTDDLAGILAFQKDIAYFSEQKCRGAQTSVNYQIYSL